MRVKQARAERFKSYDNKRKNLVEELEERERAFKKARMEKQKEEVETWQSTERIKEDGRKLREEKEKDLKKRMEKDTQKEPEEFIEEDAPPAMGTCHSFGLNIGLNIRVDPLDTTVRLKYPFKTYPTLTTPESISAFLSRFGSTDESSIVLSKGKKSSSDKPEKSAKSGTALVPFKQIGDAFAAVCASERKELGMEGMKVTWVKGDEPAILGWLRKLGKLGTAATQGTSNSSSSSAPRQGGVKAELPQNQSRDPSSAPFSSFPSSFVGIIFSPLVLLKSH